MTHLPMLLVLAAVSSDPQPTQIQPGTTSPSLVLDMCATAAANATATLAADDDDDILNSGTAAYASAAKCKRFVADFTVLANANPADNHGTQDFSIGGGITSNTWQGNKAVCESVKVNLTIYKKGVGQTSFTKKTTAAYKGVWADGPMFDMCNLTKTSGTNPPDGTPNASGSETWRVAVSATQNGTAVPVSARIAFDIIPW
jgi:hypothetical protein